MFLGGFEIIVVIGIVVWLTKRSQRKSTRVRPDPVDDVVQSWLRRWQSAGLISDDDVASIIAFEAEAQQDHNSEVSTPEAERRLPLVAEALGYLGGMLAAVGVILLVARYWPDLATWWRIAIPATVAVAGVLSGALVSEHSDDALRRLKWSLWLVGTAGLGATGGVAMYDSMSPIPAYGWNDEHRVVFGVASLVTVLSGVLWRGRTRPIQQTTFLGGLLFSIGSAADEWWELSLVGLAVWIAGLALLLIGQREIGTYPVISAMIGASAMVVGSMMMVDRWGVAGAVLLAMTSASLIGFGQRHFREHNDDLVSASLLAGVLSLVVTIPTTLMRFNDDVFEAGAAIWAIGIVVYWIGERGSARVPTVLLAIGGASLIAGPAIVAIESTTVGTLLGLLTALGCLAIGASPGRVMLSFIGAGSLLIYVPWSIAHFFPGEGRAPLLIAASGALIGAVALFLARSARRLGSERHNGEM